MNKKARSKIPFKPKEPFKWGSMDIIPPKASKSLTSETNKLPARKKIALELLHQRLCHRTTRSL